MILRYSVSLLILLFSAGKCLIQVQISPAEDFPVHEDGTRYTERDAGDNLELICEANGETEWHLPNHPDWKGFNEADVEERKEIEDGDGESTLRIKNLKETDTGRYLCRTKKQHASDTVHIYVKDDAGTSSVFFKPSNVMTRIFPTDSKVIIPCPAKRHILDARLFLDGTEVKEVAYYDSRVGFYVNSGMFSRSEENVVCEHNGDRVEFLVQVVQGSEKPLRMKLTKSTEWPYIGGNLTVTCSYDGNPLYGLRFTCPRCGQFEEKYIQGTAQGIRHINITNLRETDAGPFTCLLETKDGGGVVVNSTSFNLELGKQKEQVRIVEAFIESFYEEGQTIDIGVNARVSEEDFSVEWRKHSASVSKPGLNDKWQKLKSKKYLLDRKTDLYKLKAEAPIESATVDDSGTYMLVVTFASGFVYRQNWTISVEPDPDSVTPQIFVHPALLEKPYVVTHGRQISVSCYAKDIHKRKLQLHASQLGENKWYTAAETADFGNGKPRVTQLKGLTVDSGMQWTFDAGSSLNLKCVDEETHKVANTILYVTDFDNIDGVRVDKKAVRNFTENAEHDVLYEGDDVILSCCLPLGRNYKVDWYVDNKKFGETVKNDTKYAQCYYKEIKRAHPVHNGDYACVARFVDSPGKITKNLPIKITQAKEPEVNGKIAVPLVQAEYHHAAEILCPIDSVPPPQYKWLKDGERYNGDGKSSRKLSFVRTDGSDSGLYTCIAQNRLGSARASTKLEILHAPPTRKSRVHWWATGIVLFFSAIALLLAFLYILKQRRKTRLVTQQLQALHNQLMGESLTPCVIDEKHPLLEHIEQIPYDRKYEINKDNLAFIQLLGGGQFGQVYLGELRKSRVSDSAAASNVMAVAIKRPRDGRSVTHQKALADELKVMVAIGMHPNVLGLIGGVTKQMTSGHLYIVMEYCENNNLKTFLSKNSAGFLDEIEVLPENVNPDGYLNPRGQPQDDYLVPVHSPVPLPSSPVQKYKAEIDPQWAIDVDKERQAEKMITTSDLVSFGYQVANGMEYLTSRTCIHRDLAARNILITKNRAIRIADFGLARKDERLYHVKNSQNVPLPLKWMALESILNHDFTEESDIWAFGVLLWEIFSLGRVPYPDVPNNELISYLQDGNRMEQPKFATDEIYDLMRQCWLSDPDNRPRFAECKIIMREQLARASPPLNKRLNSVLENDLKMMERFSEWRDGAEEEDLATQAGRNGFIAVPTQEPSSPKRGENFYLNM